MSEPRLEYGEYGMFLRDYFAAKALPACYAQVCGYCQSHGWPENWRRDVADDAYKMADAMLDARAAARQQS